jgi:hypothetical protein
MRTGRLVSDRSSTRRERLAPLRDIAGDARTRDRGAGTFDHRLRRSLSVVEADDTDPDVVEPDKVKVLTHVVGRECRIQAGVGAMCVDFPCGRIADEHEVTVAEIQSGYTV